jgi:hypothetical protein
MKEYEFTLKFSLPSDANPEEFVDKLGEQGCDDALIGIGQTGRISLNFIREATSARNALLSAIIDVKKAVPVARLIEATPDLVGLTDVAEILGFSRQNMRKIMLSSNRTFPAPVHEGKPSIWHLAKILMWLKNNQDYEIDDSLVEIAKSTMNFNIAKELQELDPELQDEIKSLIA